jgi:hypothetical protein
LKGQTALSAAEECALAGGSAGWDEGSYRGLAVRTKWRV